MKYYWSKIVPADADLRNLYGNGPFEEASTALSVNLKGAAVAILAARKGFRPRPVTIAKQYLSETNGGEPLR